MISQEAELDNNSMHRDVVDKNTKLGRHKTRQTRLGRQAQDGGRQRSRGECRITLSSPSWTPQRCPIAMARESDGIAVMIL
jgi:hypothetical protein